MSVPFRYSDFRDAVARARHLFVVSDFDGTLCPLASSPEMVQMAKRTRLALERLSASPGVVLAILSGRRIEDVQVKAGVPAIYGGNHGLEISGPDIHFLHPEAVSFGQKLKTLAIRIERAITPWPEAWIESKRWTLTVHMRAVAPEQWPTIQRDVTLVVDPESDTFQLRDAHAAMEVIPVLEWDKGSAIHYLRRQLGLESSLVVCLGDDTTDESMFRALPEGITIRVGQKEGTNARYYVNNVEEATDVLEKLVGDYGKASANRATSFASM